MAVASVVPSPAVSGRLFFSYSAADEAEVTRLAAALAKHGLSIIPMQPAAQRGTAAWAERFPREIEACDLFLPVISAQSEAGADAPFRQEWQHAANRASAKTDSLPFLVPLVLENIPAATALVPEAFRTVQWIPLPAATEEAALTARLQEMLRQYDSFRLRRDRQVTASPIWIPEVESASPSPTAPAQRFGPLAWTALALGLVALAIGGVFAWKKAPNRAAKTAPANPTPAEAPTANAPALAAPPVAATAARLPPLESTRILLASFSPPTANPAINDAVRIATAELTRAFTRAAGFQVLSGTTTDLPAGIEAARTVGAGLLVSGHLTVAEKIPQLQVQVTFVASGVSYGILGPVALDEGVTGAPLDEVVERTTTGVCEASAFLQDPPGYFSKIVYSRRWARWPLAQEARALAALPLADPARRIAEAEKILRADPAMLDVKIQLVRAYRDAARYDAADALSAELFNRRDFLSEEEAFEALYDRSLLLGNMDAALSAARERSALRPRSGAIDDVVSCLFAVSRVRSAFNDFTTWLEATRPVLGPAELVRRENEASKLEILYHVRQGETAKAQVALATLKTRLGTTASLDALQLESLVLARAGSQADFDRLLDRVGDLPSLPRLEAVRTAYHFYCQFLHVGRAEDAAHFLDRAKRLWTALPPATASATDAATLLLEADLNLALQRPADALAALDRAPAPVVAAHALEFDGRRALALQDLGRTSDFAVVLAKLEGADLRNSFGLPLYWRARLAARAGLQKGAVELLRLAAIRGLWFDEARQFAAPPGRSEPEFAPLRGLPVYDELVWRRN